MHGLELRLHVFAINSQLLLASIGTSDACSNYTIGAQRGFEKFCSNYDPMQFKTMKWTIATIAVLISCCVNDATTAVSCDSYRYPKIYVYGTPYSSPNEYTYSKEYNYYYAPVYTKGSYSVYRRDDGK